VSAEHHERVIRYLAGSSASTLVRFRTETRHCSPVWSERRNTSSDGVANLDLVPRSTFGLTDVKGLSADETTMTGDPAEVDNGSTRFAVNILPAHPPNSSTLEFLSEPVWRGYVRSRLATMERSGAGNPLYPPLETLHGAWRVAHRVLGLSGRTPSVMPGEDRTVELIWNREGWHVELEIGDGHEPPYLWARRIDDRNEVVSGDLDDHEEFLREIVGSVE
jgi:hypothetical protein